MKKFTNIILLSAGILLSLTGCQKGPEINNDSDNLVRFSASTGYETRTAYSGVIKNGKERIDWTAGDKIMVWSENATVRTGGTPYFAGNSNLAVYTIGTITESDEKSIATITDPTGSGLVYPKENPGSTLWAAYPALAADKASLLDMDNNAIQLKIEAEQALTQNATTEAYAPDMQQAVMLGYVSGAKAGKTVDLPFNPAFTDFEFNLGIPQDDEAAAAYSVTITEVEFTSTSSELSGGFTATCGTDGKWTYVKASDAAKTVKATLGDGITLDKDNPNLTFNVFALPQDITNLKVTFYTNEGTKTLKLLKNDKTTWMTFDGAKKHRMNGVILPTGWYFNYITLQLEVLEWETENASADAADLPQATQFIVVGAKNGGPDGLNVGNGVKDPYRQQWYFKDGETVSFSFKVMLPLGGKWELEVYGGTEAEPTAFDPSLFTITGGTATPADAEAETPYTISGNMSDKESTLVEVTITYKGTAGEAHSLFFKSYVYDKYDNKFSIDSETQLYDRGRGYHTFFVNDEHYRN
ncbi:MAG: fimbrillin family protein [Bacteroidales bacterium]|nr:fimbrillin family protein [Fibrobacter sp.]MBR3387243.1 fimbrillin family protein [Bacteroidales bacterium]